MKMIVLPRFLHLFQSIPCFITQSYFKQLHSIIIPFIWSYKTVRISKKHLSKPKDKGGFALPILKVYYWAVHLSILIWWKKGPPLEADSCPAWLWMERMFCQKTWLSALLNSPTVVKKACFNNSSVIGNAIRIWKQIKHYIKAPKIYLDTPICENPSFLPGLSDRVFLTWKQKGICHVGDLYINGIFASYAHLAAKYCIPKSGLFRYFQIRNYVRTHLSNFEILGEHEVLEAINRFNLDDKGAVSFFYHILHKNAHLNTASIRQAWKYELDEELKDDVWDECLKHIHDCSVNVRLCLIQFKTLLLDSIILEKDCIVFIPMFHPFATDVNLRLVT